MFYAALDITAVNKEGVTAKMLIDMYIKFVHLRSLHGTFTFKIRVQNWTVKNLPSYLYSKSELT